MVGFGLAEFGFFRHKLKIQVTTAENMFDTYLYILSKCPKPQTEGLFLCCNSFYSAERQLTSSSTAETPSSYRCAEHIQSPPLCTCQPIITKKKRLIRQLSKLPRKKDKNEITKGSYVHFH